MSVPSYGSILHLGHRLLEGIFSGPVLVQEKVDGSQFSFMLDGQSGLLRCRSKGQVDIQDNPPNLFSMAVDTVSKHHDSLQQGLVYRAEAITKPKHNTLCYDRIPKGGVIVYDIEGGPADRYHHPALYRDWFEATCLAAGFEFVPTFYAGHPLQDHEAWLEFLNKNLTRQSCLGGQLVEGIVVKNFMVLGQDKKPLMGKIVREDFKEMNSLNWKQENPGKNDFLDNLSARFKTQARWAKARQHLRDLDVLANEARDIPLLIREVHADVRKECEEDIKQALFDHFWKKPISYNLTKGLAEWYKAELLKESLTDAS